MKNITTAILVAFTILLSVNKSTAKEINSAIIIKNIQNSNQLNPIFEDYFMMKDALVKNDTKTTLEKARTLLTAIEAVKVDQLKNEERTVWMKIIKKMTTDLKVISGTQDIKKQRESFKTVSKSMYELIKSSNFTQEVYYQYCPMVKANWLSKEKNIKNPYYGASMLTCGNIVETIK